MLHAAAARNHSWFRQEKLGIARSPLAAHDATSQLVGRMKSMVSTVALLTCLAVGLLAALRADAAPPALRLSGSFIQYQSEMQSWPPQTWQAVLDQMRALRMNTVIVQFLVQENNDGTLHSFIGPAGLPDATEAILSYADTNGFKVFLGLYLPNWNHDMTGSNFLFEAQTRMATTAQQAWDRYLVGHRHSSFAGWYLPYEPWTANYQPAEVERLRSFFRGVKAACTPISGEVPLVISPFISSSRPPPCRVDQLYRQLLDQSGIDILLLQDSVGAQQWETNILQHVAPYFEAMQSACRATGVRFWANLESFKLSGGVFGPCNAARLRQQFDAAAPFVEEFVTFDFVHYMNTVATLSWWTQARKDQMRQLFFDYQAGFVDVDYAPLAPPVLSASLGTDNLTLKWRGLAGDQFQVQYKTNLGDATWTTLSSTILTNDTSFSLVESLISRPASAYYQIQRLPKLQVLDSMVYLSPGTFLMGTPVTDTNKTPTELTQFQATLTRGFWISRFEVTQSDYQNLACTNPATFPFDLEQPVESVTWRNAVDFCALLTQRERQAGRLPAEYVYRLPTEVEWEYAARAGTVTRFTFGDDSALISDYAWQAGNSQKTTHSVGQRLPNPWGLEDMTGNVLEWCWDWIATTPNQPVTDYVGSTTNTYHAVRGGAWSLPWVSCRSSWRNYYPSNARSSDLGFRIVLAPANP